MDEDLIKTVTNLGSPRVLVVGDFMLDIYTYGDALRISPEAPVPVLKVRSTQWGPGGAASVAADLAELGAQVFCIGVIGTDANGRRLTELLDERGIDTSDLLALDTRPTTSKRRLIGLAQHRHRQQLMRIDQESSEPLSSQQYRFLLERYGCRLGQVDIVCLQDYDKAVLSDAVCRQVVELAGKAGKKILVDPAFQRDYRKYAGATVITPNRREAGEVVGFEIDDEQAAAKAARQLRSELGLEAVVITLDKEGAYLETPQTSELIPARERSVYDVTGAGDIVLAALAVCLASGCDYKTAVQIANIAGGIEVEKFGAVTVSLDEIVGEIVLESRSKAGKICEPDVLIDRLQWHRGRGQTIVFTNGCFDVLHRGHIEFLKFCKNQGQIVVVGLNSDESVRKIKGPGRPVNNQNDRASVLAALETVDYVTIFDEPDPLELIKQVRPNVLVKGQDWAEKGVVGREFVESLGGKVVLAPLVEGKSTTSVIERIKSSHKTS